MGEEPIKIRDQYNGKGIIETYTIIYTRDHEPSMAVIYGRTHDDFRFIARTQNSPEIISQLTTKNMVGQKVNIAFDSSQNINIADLI